MIEIVWHQLSGLIVVSAFFGYLVGVLAGKRMSAKKLGKLSFLLDKEEKKDDMHSVR